MNDTLAAELVKAVNRVAAAYERMAQLAEAKQHAAPNGNGGGGERPSRAPKGDILTVTDTVASFGIAIGVDGQPKLTKPKAPKEGEDPKPRRKYWNLNLSGGFAAKVFSESQAKRCATAFETGASLIVEYIQSGNYANIESVKVAAGAPPRQAAPQAATEVRLSCGHLPSDDCSCAF